MFEQKLRQRSSAMTTPVAAPALNFVVFYVADLEQSFRFFKETLGLIDVPEGHGPNFRQFDGGAGMGFGLLKADEQTPPPGAVDLYLKAENLEALRESWVANGVAATPIVQMPFGPIFEITTPDGRKLTPIG
jgi:predicted enzyme related to lactoylglutathione lyase